MRKAGYEFEAASATLRAFAKHHTGLSSDNFDALAGFLTETDLGKALIGVPPRSSSSGVRFLSRIEAADAKWAYAFKPEGLYYVYHGSHLLADHYVIRAMEISRPDPRMILVEDWLKDNRTIANAVHKAPGMLLTFDKWVEIATFHQDNSFGIRLMVLPEIHPDQGSMQGHLSGMTKSGQPFTRAVRLKKARRVKSLTDLTKETGIFRRGELGKHEKEFAFLAQTAPCEPFEDPVSVLRLTSVPGQLSGQF